MDLTLVSKAIFLTKMFLYKYKGYLWREIMGLDSVNNTSTNGQNVTNPIQDVQDLYATRKEETLEKESIYRAFQDKLAIVKNLKVSIWNKLQIKPDDNNLKNKYSEVNNSYSNLAIDGDCAWWSWHDAVDSQRKAIYVV